jgi:peptide/nickel transport system substrate-binding protein
MAFISGQRDPQRRFPLRGWLPLIATLVACGARGAAVDSDREQPITVLWPRDAQEIDPRFAGDAYGHKLSRLIFASLVTIDPYDLTIVPDLAERIEIVEPTLYRVVLRPDLRFSDGSALDSADVAATFRSVVDPALGTRYARTYERITAIQVHDARTLDFRLREPHATFMTDLELPVMRAEDAGRRVGAIGGAPAIGAGPYVLRRRETGLIELAANPHWHRGQPLHPEVRMLVVRDDNTRALRLLAGAGDLAMNAVPPLLLPLFERDPRFEVESMPGVGTTYLGLNLEAPALRDPRVRQALAAAIDRRALVAAKLGGRARLARSWIVPGHWAYAADAGPRHEYDPARARALLRQAGLEARGSQPALKLTLRCGSDRMRLSIARALAAMLAQVSIELAIRPTEMATLIADLNRGRFELTMLEVPEVVEPHVLSWFFGGDHVPGEGGEGANRWRLRSRALDQALERGRANVDPAARSAAYRDAQRILAEELPVIPLWHEDVVAVRSARLRGMRVPRLARFDVLAR